MKVLLNDFYSSLSMDECSTDLVEEMSCLLSNKRHAKLEIQEDELLLKGCKEIMESKLKEVMITDKCVDKVPSGHELEVWKPALDIIFQ